MSGSGIRWAMCKSAPRTRQTTTPEPHHSFFYRPDALPAAQAAQPSVKALKANTYRDTEVYYQVRQKTDQVCNMTTAFTFITQLCLPELYDLIKVSHWGTYDKTVNMWLKMLQQLYAEIICRSKQQ